MSKYNLPMINAVKITGTVVNNPRVDRTKGSNSKVVNFRIASIRKFRTKDHVIKNETTFVSVTAWAGLAQICAVNLEKGDKVYIEGGLQSKQFSDSKISVVEILADKIQILTPKKIALNENEKDNYSFEDNEEEELGNFDEQ